MPELIASAHIDDVILVRPDVHGDERGRFVETYRRSWFGDEGNEMVQGNRSEKQAGALVGLHYHLRQADYWYALRGTVRVVLHDLRVGSRTDGATQVIDLSARPTRGSTSHAGWPTASPPSPTSCSRTWSTNTTTIRTSSDWPGTTRRSGPTGA